MRNFFKIIFKVIILVFYTQVNGQTNAKNVSDTEMLEVQMKRQSNDSLKLIFLQASLRESKKQLNIPKTADAYYFLSKLDYPNKEAYLDSLIEVAKNIKHKKYPAIGYRNKGNIEYSKGNYQKALDLYLLALKYAKENKNENLFFSIKFNIGLLKNNVGDGLEARKIFVNFLNFQDRNVINKNPKTYNKVLFALADSYVAYKSELDSAKKYIYKGIQETLKTGDTIMYPYFVVRSGIYNYHFENYEIAIDSLQKGKYLIERQRGEKIRMAVCDYFIALSYNDLDEKEKSIEYFKNVDSALKETVDIVPILLNSYNYLINHYKSKNDTKKQLEYVNTLLKLDSVRDDNQTYLTKNIIKKYDTVELISVKENLIEQLQNDKFLQEETIVKLVIFVIVLLLIAIYSFRRSYVNKRRFLKLLNTSPQKQSLPEKPLEQKSRVMNINQETLDDLLAKLKTFEDEEMYLNPDVNARYLAENFKSNSSYLSLVVNTYKQKNISKYINDLRIDYVVNKLKSDSKLRKYTIKAIAREVGFNSSEIFAKTFRKKTGLYPSYFIKELERKV